MAAAAVQPQQAPEIHHVMVEGPVLYVPILIRHRADGSPDPDNDKTLYLFGDRHQNTESCMKKLSRFGPIGNADLVTNTLNFFRERDQTVDMFAEIGFGSEQKNTFSSLINGVYTRDSRQRRHIDFLFERYYQKGCFKQPVDGECLRNFRNTRFHNIDFRQTLQFECRKILSQLCISNPNDRTEVRQFFMLDPEVKRIFNELDENIARGKDAAFTDYRNTLSLEEYRRMMSVLNTPNIDIERAKDNILGPATLARIATEARAGIDAVFEEHRWKIGQYLEEYPGWNAILLRDLLRISRDRTKLEKERSIASWVHFLLTIKFRNVMDQAHIPQILAEPLVFYKKFMNLFMDPIGEGLIFYNWLDESIKIENRYGYVDKYQRVPYYQYKLENMIRKTSEPFQPDQPLQEDQLRTARLSAIVTEKLHNLRQPSDENFIVRTSILLDLFFVIRLFENFNQGRQGQVDGPIRRVIAYVGAAHVQSIIDLLIETVAFIQPTTKAGFNNAILRSSGAFSSPIDDQGRGLKAIRKFNEATIYEMQCIRMPLQINGETLILPQNVIGNVTEKDAKIYATAMGYLEKSPVMYPPATPLDTEERISEEAYQNYLQLSDEVKQQFKDILRIEPASHREIIALLNHPRPAEVITERRQRFGFGKKRDKKNKKSVKKSTKVKKSVNRKKSVKKSKVKKSLKRK